MTLGQSQTDYDPTTGIIANSSGICLIPAAVDNDARCINGRNNFNAPLDPPLGVIPASQRDGRVFNLHLYGPGSSPRYQTDTQLGPARSVVGAFSRIHTTRTLIAAAPTCPGVGGDGRCCEQLDATEQIGCLVQADPCAFGLADRAALDFQLQTSATAQAAFGVSINNIESGGCTGAGYPLSGKVYLNTAIGFQNVTGQELELAKCLSGSAVGFNTTLETLGLAPLPTGPVCQDFPQETCPSHPAASNACATNTAGIAGVNHCEGVSLDDGKPCTSDTCDPTTGVVTHTSAAGYACGLGSCAGGTATTPSRCDAVGNCVAGTTVSCGGFACAGSSCGTSCTDDSQCASGSYCDPVAGNCLPGAGPNQACARDRQCSVGACVDGDCCDATATADPLASVAIDPRVPTSFATQAAPLYLGVSASQAPVTAGIIDPAHVAIIRGKVLTETGTGRPCAKISVVGQPGVGSTRTRADGAYSIAVNGGGPVTIRVELSGYLTADRQVPTQWNAYAIAQDVRLLSFGQGTEVSSSTGGITIASGAAEPDGTLGTRTARLLIPPGTRATIDGIAFDTFNVQIKDLTNVQNVGHDGLPASLPVTSAFTYAVSLSVQNAENKPVALTNSSGQPQQVPFYVENFLGMPNGEAVPVGYYDPTSAQWIASDNGLVLTIASKDPTTGEARLDVDTNPGADPSAAADLLGIFLTERLALGTAHLPNGQEMYPVGTSLWRFTTSHFSAWDANWGWGPPPGAGPPGGPPPGPPPCGCCGPGSGSPPAVGSIIDCELQGLREKIPLAGTPFDLFYSSRNQLGGIQPLHIPITGTTLPPGVTGIQLEIYVAGRKVTQFWSPPFTLPAAYDFYWDGFDVTGRRLYGAQPILTRVGYTYSGSYQRTARFGDNGNGTVISASRSRFETTLWQESLGFLNQWDAQQSGLGGWDVNVHHGYDPLTGTLHLGTGQTLPVAATTMRTLAQGDGSALSFNLHAPALGGDYSVGIAVDTDGTVFFADPGNSQIWKIPPHGTATKVAIDTTLIQTNLREPRGLAIGPDHRLYVCDRQNNRIVRIDPASGHAEKFGGDGSTSPPNPHADGLATASSLVGPLGIAVAADGTVYVAEGGKVGVVNFGYVRRIRDGQMTTLAAPSQGASYLNGVAVSKLGDVYYTVAPGNVNVPAGVYRIGQGGQATQVAGGAPSTAAYGDGGPATSAYLVGLGGIAIGPDGFVYVADTLHHSIRRIDANGLITTVAGRGALGNGAQGDGADGQAPYLTALDLPTGIAFGGDGMLYLTDDGNEKIRGPAQSSTTGSVIPSADGAELYYFDPNQNNQHFKTVDAHTGITKYTFEYDLAGYLTAIYNRDANDPNRLKTQIVRDTSEIPLSVKSPFGQTTTLSVVGSQLTSVMDPEGGNYQLSYWPKGLLKTLSEPTFPANQSYKFAFTNGQLTTDTDPLTHSQGLSFAPTPNVAGGQRVTRTDQLGRATFYDTQTPDASTVVSAITTPDGLQLAKSIRRDGLPVYTAPNGTLYSAHQSNPNGSTAYWQIANDAVSGVHSPFMSARLEFMGSQTDPVKATSFTRAPVLSNSSDLASIISYGETDTVNGQPSILSYVAATNTFTSTSRAGRTTKRIIDAFDRTTSIQIGNLTPTTFSYDDSTTTGTGTQQVSLVEQNDATIDRKTQYTYFGSGLGKPAGYLKQVSHTQAGAAGQTTTYTRDAFGRVLTATTGSDAPILAWTDGRGNLTAVTPTGEPKHDEGYDLLNQITTYTAPAPTTGGATMATGFTYTDDRKRDTITTPDNITAKWAYDTTTGKLSKVTPDTSAPGVAATYTYFTPTDVTNHVAGAAPGELSQISGPYGVNLAFQYLGALQTKTTWSGGVAGSVAWTYDIDFARISETVTGNSGSAATVFGYDLDKLITCASAGTCTPTPDASALSVVHDPLNGLLSLIAMGRVKETYSYNNFGELAQKLATSTTPVGPLAEFDFDKDSAGDNGTWPAATRRDALGRITRKVETVVGSATNTYDYKYSAEGRLTDVFLNGNTTTPAEHYDYDPNGNRVVSTAPPVTVTIAQTHYDQQDRLLTYGNFTYTYTNNGELKTKTDTSFSPARVTTYSYDTLGNLLSVAPPASAPVISYIVDGMNRRVAKKIGTTVVKQWLYHDSLKPIAELDGTGALVSSFVYASNPNVPDYMIRGGKTYRLITDQVGTVRMVVNINDTSDRPWSATYTAFGVQTITAAIADFMPFGFGGGMFDVDTGLVRFGVRDYDPVVGRWTAKDPLRFGGGQDNLYAYVNNDPVNKIDPGGREVDGCDEAAIAACALVCNSTVGEFGAATGAILGTALGGPGPGTAAGAGLGEGLATGLCALSCAINADEVCHPKPHGCDPQSECCGGDSGAGGASSGASSGPRDGAF